MTWKQIDTRLNAWLTESLLRPVAAIALFLRTNYIIEGQAIYMKRAFRKPVCLNLTELDEIGVETTDQGPFIEDVFWILKHGNLRFRIGDPHPVFKVLMDRFGKLEGFDWRLFTEAMCCTDNRYFICWKRDQSHQLIRPSP